MKPPFSYDDILRARPMLGSVKHGEVELAPLFSAEEQHGPYGVIYQDKWVTVVRDPVILKNYSPGAHIRILEGDPTKPVYGAIVLAMRPNQEGDFDVAWIRQWRHCLQGWTTELPRGGTNPGESMAEGALRELREETGLRSPEILIHLGDMANNTGISATVNGYYAAVYLGHARVIQREQQESESISNVIWAPFSQWRQMVGVPGVEGRPVGPMDGYTAAAFGLAYMTGYMKHIPRVWKHMFGRGVMDDPRVAPFLKTEVAKGSNSLDLKVRCTQPDAVQHFLREVPMLQVVPCEDANLLQVKGATLLMLSWFACSPLVERIDAL